MFFSIPRYGLRAAQDHAPAPSNLGAQAPPTAAQTANSALPAATGGPPVRALRMRESGARRRRGRRPRRISSFSSGFVHLLPNPGHGCRGPFLHPSGRWQVRIGPGLQGGSGGPSPPPALGPTPAPGGSSQSRPPWGLFWGGGASPRAPPASPRSRLRRPGTLLVRKHVGRRSGSLCGALPRAQSKSAFCARVSTASVHRRESRWV